MKENTIPTTTRQAFRILDGMISPEEKDIFLSQKKSDFVAEQHYSLGAWIRNNWIYGNEDETPEEAVLRERCYRILAGMKKEDNMFEHPDCVSGIFLRKYYNHLKRISK